MNTSEAIPEGWTISSDLWPFPEFTATHADYDASYEGEEDGWADNGLIATGKTRAEVLAEIAVIEAEHPHFQEQSK